MITELFTTVVIYMIINLMLSVWALFWDSKNNGPVYAIGIQITCIILLVMKIEEVAKAFGV